MDRSSGPTLLSAQSQPDAVNETRVTRSGKIIRYELRIVQQPERARACGAGAKASADRRPVDPPPILALRIFEQASANHMEQDVTFQLQADYMVFTSLVSAQRPMAQPRNTPSVSSHNSLGGEVKKDVLAGQNVVSASPYERPEPALYFIFPDLSVRHEGKYRFIFSMFERLKSIDDEDRNELLPPGQPSDFTCRIETESAVFDVFSAKRFPGLTTSTHLSRQLAEQGSRIRIRRDIRMHRKDKKPQAKDWDDYHDDENNNAASGNNTSDMLASQPSRLLHTPDPYTQQPPRYQPDALQRPQSAGSRGPPTATDSLSRRTSLNDLTHSYIMQPSQHQQQQQQAPPFAHPHPSNAGYQSVQTPSYSQQSYMHPPTQYTAPPYQSQSQSQPQPPSQTQPQHHHRHQQQQQQQQPQQNYYHYGSTQQQQMQYPPMSTAFDNNPYQQRTSGDYSTVSSDSRRTSMQSVVPQAAAPFYGSQSAPTHSQQSNYSQPPPMYSDSGSQSHSIPHVQSHQQEQQQSTTSSSTDIFLPRDQTSTADSMRPQNRIASTNPPTLNPKADFSSDLPTKLPPLTTRTLENKLDAAASPSTAAPVSAFSSSLPTPTESHKRAYGSTFATSWQNMANKQGARPGDDVFTSNGISLAADPDIDSSSDTMAPYEKVTYRRAGGATATRTHV